MKAHTLVTALGLATSTVAQSLAINGVEGATQPRLEVRQLAAEQPEQWSLYVLALQQWQNADNNATTSYYQVSGIHGVPRVSWDGVEPCDGCENADGYCTHDSILFPVWHRTYVALFEQELVAVAQSIADSYPESSRAQYQAAAASLRVPYWDWAAQACVGSVLPTSLSGPEITVTGPNGQQTIDNPLYSYTFENPSDLVYQYFTTWDHTLRYPQSASPASGSQDQSCSNAFDNIQPNLQDQVYQLMSTCDDFKSFSNDNADSASPNCANSIEAIHNIVHSTSGGPATSSVNSGGHMTYLPVAGFDPIFWLHHANVDRLFAIWQAIHPDSYGASQVAPHQTWAIEEGSEQDANSPLAPFHKDSAGAFWTTNEVRDWDATFHYTYPEFVSTDGSPDAVASIVNELYGPSATMCAGQVPASDKTVSSRSSPAASSTGSSSSSYAVSSTSKSYPSGTVPSSKANIAGGIYQNSSTYGAAPSTRPYTSVAPPPKFVAHNNGSQYQYVANCETQRYSMNGSYYVLLFNGEPSSEDVSTWFGDANLIGLLSFVAGGDMVNSMLSTGSIPLTRTLQKLVSTGLISDMSEASCVPWLKKNLVWKIIGPNGEDVVPSDVPGFKVSVYSSTSTNAGQYSLPKWSGFVPHYEVTDNKSGGASAASPPSYGSSGSDSGPASTGGSSGSSPSNNGSSSASAPSYGSGSNGGASSPPAEGAEHTYVGDDDITTVTIWTTQTTTSCPCATA